MIRVDRSRLSVSALVPPLEQQGAGRYIGGGGGWSRHFGDESQHACTL